MTCDDFQYRISAYMDGEMSSWSRWKVQTHLRFCPDCAGMLKDLSEVDNCIMASADSQQAPDYLTAAVMHRLPAMPPASRPRQLRLTFAAGMALLAMNVAGVGGAYWWGFTRGAEVTQAQGGGAVVNSSAPTSTGASSVVPVGITPRIGVLGSYWPTAPAPSVFAPPQHGGNTVKPQPKPKARFVPGQSQLQLQGAQ